MNLSDGFRSPEAKRRLTRTAWLVAILVAGMQMVVPIVLVGAAVVDAIIQAFKSPSAEIEGATWHEGALWYVRVASEGSEQGEPRSRVELVRVDPRAEHAAGTAARLDIDASRFDDIALLSHDGALYLVGERFVARRDSGGALEVHRLEEARLGISRPFVYRGQLAVARDERDAELVIETWDGARWTEATRLVLGLGEERLVTGVQVLPVGERLHVFVEDGEGTVHYAAAQGDRMGRFVEVTTDQDWSVALLGGEPVLFTLEGDVSLFEESDETPPRIVAHALHGPLFKPFANTAAPGAIKLAAVSLGSDVAILTDGTFGGDEVRVLADGSIGAPVEHAAGSPMARLVSLLVLAETAPLLLSLLVALLLSWRMSRHRVLETHVADRAVPLASLARRTLARIVDSAIAAAIPLAFVAQRFVATGTVEQSSVLGVALLSGGALFFVFSWLEGTRGQTPGKRLLGIRVIGLADGEPCGFGRAVKRSLAGIVDSFFQGLVGILLIALGPHLQRFGDRAAGTVVVRAREATVAARARGLTRPPFGRTLALRAAIHAQPLRPVPSAGSSRGKGGHTSGSGFPTLRALREPMLGVARRGRSKETRK